MSNTELSSLIKIFLCFALMFSFEAYQEFKVYRLIQYESEEKVYGSQYTTLNYIGSHYKGDLLRKIALIKFSDISSLEELKMYINSNANALLFILPKPESLTDKLKEFILQTQRFLSEQTLFIPVYFTNESKEVNEIYTELEEISRDESPEKFENSTTGNRLSGYFKVENNLLQFSLSASDPKKQDSLNFENIYGYLEGNSAGGVSNPILLITTYYDDFSVLPDYPSGLNTNASGVITILEIIRVLAKFYETYDTFVHYDILFMLSSAGSLNYQGSNHYINSLESSVLENIQYVLCLDSLSLHENELYMHLSRFPKQEDEVAFKLQKVRLNIKKLNKFIILVI
jgi:hypothetical protein